MCSSTDRAMLAPQIKSTEAPGQCKANYEKYVQPSDNNQAITAASAKSNNKNNGGGFVAR